MASNRKWMTPFTKQCFVVLGASINISQIGLVMGFAAALVPQLQASSAFPVSDSSGSWIAALPGFALILGNLVVPTLMVKLGRRWANLISIAIVIAGWTCILVAHNIILLLIARLLQGISAGMSSCLMPILIGEYASPEYRGGFSVLMSLIMAIATLTVHTVGSYFTWKKTAFVMTIISLVDILIAALSPETPMWLANQGRHEECEQVFRWLRGDEDAEELHSLIEDSIIAKQQKNSLPNKGYMYTLKRRKFYKPIIIMIHLHTMGQWGGINILTPYISRVVQATCGTDIDIPLTVLSVDVQRVLTSICAVFIVTKVKRRTMLFTTCGMNAVVLLVTAGYLYAKEKGVVASDRPFIGILLVHALMMTVSIGSLPLPYTIAGEIFALRYKSFSSGFTSIFYSIHIFVATKTFPYLLKTLGIHGAYCLYGAVMIYCLTVAWFMLPETKDRTLQEIEAEFKGNVVRRGDLKAAEPLTNIKSVDEG